MTHTTRPRCSPTLTRLSKGVRSALGFTLTEALLALGAVTAATGAMFLFFGQVDAKAKVGSETRNLRELSRRIENSFGVVGTFRGVSTTAVVVDGLAPESQLGIGESVLTNAWGGAVNVQPYTVDRFGDSFSVSYAGLPRQASVDLVAANAGGVWDAQVSDVSVIRNTGGQLDVGLLGRTCADKSRVVFVYHSGLLGGEWTGAPLVLPPATPSVTPPVSPPVGTPVGPVGPVPPSTPVSPPTAPPPSVPPTTPPPVTPPAPPVSVTPPAPPTSPPVTPPPPTSTVPPCQEWSENRPIACPSGQVGQVFAQTRVDGRPIEAEVGAVARNQVPEQALVFAKRGLDFGAGIEGEECLLLDRAGVRMAGAVDEQDLVAFGADVGHGRVSLRWRPHHSCGAGVVQDATSRTTGAPAGRSQGVARACAKPVLDACSGWEGRRGGRGWGSGGKSWGDGQHGGHRLRSPRCSWELGQNAEAGWSEPGWRQRNWPNGGCPDASR